MSYKYVNLRKGLKQYENIGTGRIGFYIYNSGGYGYYSAYVYVNEIDRYSDGYSKIKINNIEPFNKNYISGSLKNAKDSFLTLRKTNDIEWLESEDNIRKIRKEKLENLKKL